MDLVNLVILVWCVHQSAAASLITADLFEARGQQVCKVGHGRPCYKLAYFSDPVRRLSFLEAELACRRDGGELLSIESANEQRIVEQLITELRPSDGDFWIGLRRHHGDTDSVVDCPSRYYWTDGSHASFRNWHWDEPSCGYEVCVVMYHQPSVSVSPEGLYMFNWNDDNCDTKNNFICKYKAENAGLPSPSPNTTNKDAPPHLPLNPTFDPEVLHPPDLFLDLLYIILPTILLLFVMAGGVVCFKVVVQCRKKSSEQQTEVCPTDQRSGPSPAQSPDVYNVIRSQQEADLAGARPHTKNTSFLGSSPDTPPGDYDNLGGLRDTESGFVTLASTDSNFLLTSDQYDLSLGRRNGNRDTFHNSLGRHGNREVYNNSLGRHGNREVYNHILGHHGNKEMYDNDLSHHGNRETYNNTVDHHGNIVNNTELYNTSYCGESLYQSSLDHYGNPESHRRSKSHHEKDASSVDHYGKDLDYYGNEGGLGGRYFREWLDSDSY
ncbi:hypothetical protein UPYG_G00130530 [Umbra pygmaea]|uniref:C-type lectin domain-containing protein n=1 Tax=Umbra pygmaea TaxID=75934 RepID=A0ABD0X762_UMBPY